MNNAPLAARMPAAGTEALLSIRPGGQRLAAWEVLAGRDRLGQLAPGHGERLATRLQVWDRSSRWPSPAVLILSAHRVAPKSGVHGHIADVAGFEFRPVPHKCRPAKPFRAGSGFAPESPIWTPCTGVAPKQTSSTESAICACRAALTVRDVRDAAWLPHSMASAAMGFELTETAGTPCVEAGMPGP